MTQQKSGFKWARPSWIPNIMVDSRALMRASIPFLILILSNAFIMILGNWRLSQLHEEMIVANPEGAVQLMRFTSDVVQPVFTALITCSILSLLVWLFFSHRIFGPIVSIRRRINALANGDYQSRIRLRANDEFKEVAVDLNKLAEVLAKSKTS
jgi:methyl-accepting chemotaxis protein